MFFIINRNLWNARRVRVRNGTIYDDGNVCNGEIKTDGVIQTSRDHIRGKIEANETVHDDLSIIIGKIEDDGAIPNKNIVTIARIPYHLIYYPKKIE